MNQVPTAFMTEAEKISIFSRLPIDYLLVDAVFSDETNNYVSPCEPTDKEPVAIRLRTGLHNVDAAFIHINGEQMPLIKEKDEGAFTYYIISLPGIFKTISYYFSITKNKEVYYYNKRGLYKDWDENFNFKIIPNFKTPDWAKGAVMYQIYVDRFYNGDKTNDVVNNEYAYLSKAARQVEEWDAPVSTEDVCNFYGGDLQGVMDKMAYLKDLGVEAIYFNPIFVSPSNHKYDIQDYDYVDPHYGVIVKDGGEPLSLDKFHNRFATMYVERTTNIQNLEASNQLLVKLIGLAHENGIKVILDGVFNHCGAFNKWLDREGFYQRAGYPIGAYATASSPYNKFFKWYDQNWPNNDAYDGWWGHDNHPKLNFEASPELCDAILNIGRKWVSPPYNADGWRLDVAADLGSSPEFNHYFWREFRKAVREANPNAIILAEHYGDPSSWLEGDQWDTIMNYDAFMEPVTYFLTGMEKHSEEFKPELLNNAMYFEQTMRYHMSKLSVQSLSTAMNELSNHDHSRFLTRTNRKVGRLHTVGSQEADTGIDKSVMYAAVLLQMTWPGAPAVYYGDEAGLTGWTDPDNRRTYPWGKEDSWLVRFHKEMIALRKEYRALKTGSLEYLYNNYGILSYGRWDEDHRLVIVINNNEEEKKLQIPVWKSGVNAVGRMGSLLSTSNGFFHKDQENYAVKDGVLAITMKPKSSMVLIEQ